MKRFNQTISIEVQVDAIADKLLSTFPEDYKHRELLTEAIIATSVDKGTVGYIYNALSGYSADIDFKEKEFVMCNDTVWDWNKEAKEDKRRKMGKARIKEINIYTPLKLLVEYYHYKPDGSVKLISKWVDHKECTKDAVPYFDEEAQSEMATTPEEVLASIKG